MSDIIFPTYYKRFQCSAGLCRHTCCRDWEITIDRASLTRFKDHPEIQSRIKGSSYILEPDGRCPFLMDDGLCYQIKTYGEDFICDICRQHPRFYFSKEGKTYGGVSLACEEAAKLILLSKEPFSLEGGEELSSEISSFEESPDNISHKIDKMAPVLTSSLMRARIFLDMEYLESSWVDALNRITDLKPTREQENAILEEYSELMGNFIVYMLYRYNGYPRLACETALLLADLILAGIEPLEAARMFSSEVEYSDINIEEAKSLFGQGDMYGN